MKDLVLSNPQQGDRIETTPFMFQGQGRTSPSKFKITFIMDDIRYHYGFDVNRGQIVNEFLYYWPKGRISTIFQRTNTTDFYFTQDIEEQNSLAKRTLPNRLYLSCAASWNFEKALRPFEWFRKKLLIGVSSFEHPFEVIQASQKDPRQKQFTLNFLNKADIDILDFDSKIEPLKDHDFPQEMPEELKAVLRSSTHAVVKTIREIVVNEEKLLVEFDMEKQESAGTIKMFILSKPIMDALANGKVLLLDEIDRSLHPFLVDYIINLFQSNDSSKAQLIFTTHNTSILSASSLRRDQIWFAQKNEDKATSLYSLSELKARKDENIEKGYLSGRYGAVPFIDKS